MGNKNKTQNRIVKWLIWTAISSIPALLPIIAIVTVVFILTTASKALPTNIVVNTENNPYYIDGSSTYSNYTNPNMAALWSTYVEAAKWINIKNNISMGQGSPLEVSAPELAAMIKQESSEHNYPMWERSWDRSYGMSQFTDVTWMGKCSYNGVSLYKEGVSDGHKGHWIDYSTVPDWQAVLFNAKKVKSHGGAGMDADNLGLYVTENGKEVIYTFEEYQELYMKTYKQHGFANPEAVRAAAKPINTLSEITVDMALNPKAYKPYNPAKPCGLTEFTEISGYGYANPIESDDSVFTQAKELASSKAAVLKKYPNFDSNEVRRVAFGIYNAGSGNMNNIVNGKGQGAVYAQLVMRNYELACRPAYAALYNSINAANVASGIRIYAGPVSNYKRPKPAEEYANNHPTFRKFITVAEQALGTPYLMDPDRNVNLPGRTFDCSGFVKWAWEQTYGLKRGTAFGGGNAESIYTQCVKVEPKDVRPGDFVFFTGTYAKKSKYNITHITIYTGGMTMLGSGDPNHYGKFTLGKFGVGKFYCFARPKLFAQMPDY